MISRTRIAATLALVFGLATGVTSALAHDDAYLDTDKTPNGGQLRMAGLYHYELVLAKDAKEVKESPITVYLTDHAGQKIPSAGATGTVTILVGKLKSSATLQPDGDNRLKGVAKYSAMPELKAVVSITMPGKSAEQARFTPLAIAMGKDAPMQKKP